MDQVILGPSNKIPTDMGLGGNDRRVRPVARVRALSELVGNLPFVAEAFPLRPDLFDSVQRAFAGIELAHLHFRKDDSYWEAIEKAGL